MPRFGFGITQCPLDVDELTRRRAAKAMHSTALDTQSITPLAHDTFEAIFPLKPIRPFQMNKAT